MRIFYCDFAGCGECCFGIWQSPDNPDLFSSPIATNPDRDRDKYYDEREYGVCQLFLNDSYISEKGFEYEIDENNSGDGGVPLGCPIYQGEIDPPQFAQVEIISAWEKNGQIRVKFKRVFRMSAC